MSWSIYDDEPYPGPMEAEVASIGTALAGAMASGYINFNIEVKEDFTDPLKNLTAGLRYAKSAYGSAWKTWVGRFVPEPEHDPRTCPMCNPKLPEIKLLGLGDIGAMNAYQPITLEFPPAKNAIQKPDLEAIRAKMNNGPKQDPFKRLGR